jgi:hypothetical protein
MGTVAITFAKGETASKKNLRFPARTHSNTHLLICSFTCLLIRSNENPLTRLDVRGFGFTVGSGYSLAVRTG